MKKSILNFGASIVILSLFFYSCQKEKEITNQQPNYVSNKGNADYITPPNNITLDAYRIYIRKEYSKALAKSIASLEVRNFLKEKINLTLLGETEMLHAEYFNEVLINSGNTFSQTLANNSSHDVTFFTDSVILYDPRLTILIPDDYYPENWQTQSYLPKVTYNPAG
jgi:hypothetical protein